MIRPGTGAWCLTLWTALALAPACGGDRESPDSPAVARPAGERPAEVAPAAESTARLDGRPRRLDGYTARIFKWAYYLIPAGLSREDLLAQASDIHRAEPDAQLVLVDDASQVQAYVAHAKAVTEGRTDVELPQAWADVHVVANLQKMTSGRWMLYKGYGYEEIGEVK